MVSGHPASQALLLERDLILLLLELEQVVSANSIGELACNVLKRAMNQPSVVADAINEKMEARRDAARQRAEAGKQKAIASAARSLSPDLEALLEQIPDEDGWTCCICKEGYDYLPELLLGFYVYVDGRESSTTTHFVGIHPRCHQQNRTMNRDQSEWEIAAVRNCERPCNAIFPIPSASVAPGDYFAAVSQFYLDFGLRESPLAFVFSDLQNKLTITANLRMSSNGIEFAPFLIFAGHCFLDAAPPSSALAVSRAASMTRFGPVLAGTESCRTAFAQAILLLSLEEWGAARLQLLRATLRAIAPPPDLPDEELFVRVRNALCEYVITDTIHRDTKAPSGTPSVLADGKVVLQAPNTTWVQAFCDQLQQDGMGMCAKFRDVARKLGDEILDKQDPALFFAAVGDLSVLEQPGGPYAWLRSAIAP
jgi:E3 ubiquitin-protein ligase UBR4